MALHKVLTCLLRDNQSAGVEVKRILGESLLISSLPGKALRTLVESRGLPSNSTCNLEAEPGKLDIKRHSPGFLLISYQVG